MNQNTLTAAERRNIVKKICADSHLTGVTKVESLGQALNFLNVALNNAGFQIGLVTGDILLGEIGSRILGFTRSDERETEIETCGIVFSWEKLERGHCSPWEVICYLS